MSRFELAWLAATATVLAVIATIAAHPEPLLVWNVSPSAPVGLYAVLPGTKVAPGEMVVARLPVSWRELAAARGYIPKGIPLVKRVAAVPGDRVCAKGREIRINGRFAALRLGRDRRGRPLSAWRGCVTLKAHQLFLLNGRSDSFDGRYFGATGPAELVGKARLLWRA
jgi:conjugative transfer signal peptidase TraF